MQRRRFVKRSLELVIAAQCLPLLDEPAAALQPRSTTRPALTEASLNAIIPRESAELRAFAGQMFPDMKAYIRARFELSAEQERALVAMSGASIARIHQAVEAAMAKGARISVVSVTGAAAPSDLAARGGADGALRVECGGGGCLQQGLVIR
jgi:hypothetical protein